MKVTHSVPVLVKKMIFELGGKASHFLWPFDFLYPCICASNCMVKCYRKYDTSHASNREMVEDVTSEVS